MAFCSLLQTELKKATENGHAVLEYLQRQEKTANGFEPHSSGTELLHGSPLSVHASRKQLAEAATRLLQLATVPREYLDQVAGNFQHVMCLRWLVNLRILEHIPLNETVPYDKLALLAAVPEPQLRSVCRMAITHNFLSEPEPDKVSHNGNSALLATDESFLNWARFAVNYSLPTAYKFPDATTKWGQTEAKNETAFQLAMGIDVPFFDHLRKDKEMNAMFSSYMNNVASTEGISFKHLVNGFDWASLPEGATVVDVGGSRGHASQALATEYPHLNFIVQDLPETIANAAASSEVETSRIRFMPHDFFKPQPVQDADVYLLRMIIHDWPDTEALKILGHLRAALKPGARLVIMDTVLPQPGSISVLQERQLRVRDLTMMQVFNAKERELETWETLVGKAGMGVLHVEQPTDSVMGILTVGLRHDANGTQNGVAVTNGNSGSSTPVKVSEHVNGLFSSSDDLDGETPQDAQGQILIIGGGIGGLCFAQGLKKAGIPFTIFERDVSEAYRPQGYRLKLEADAAAALEECLPKDVFEGFKTSCAISTIGETDYNPLNGDITKSRAGGGLAGSQGLQAAYTVDRATFRSVLMNGIEEHVLFGKDLFYYNVDGATVNAVFKDGSRAAGRLLVGADGSRSAVRKQLLPKHKYVDTGAVCIYGKTRMTEEFLAKFPERGLRWMTAVSDQAPLIQSILIGNSPLTLLCEPIRFTEDSRRLMELPDDYVYWVLIGRREIFTHGDSAPSILERSCEASAQQSLDLTAEWHPSLKALFELQDVEQCSTLRVVSQTPEIQPWEASNNVTLLGDAIHAMSPCGGVGANTALRDAAELTRTVRAGDESLSAKDIGLFEEGLRKRAFKSLMRSYAGSKAMFDQQPFGQLPSIDI